MYLNVIAARMLPSSLLRNIYNLDKEMFHFQIITKYSHIRSIDKAQAQKPHTFRTHSSHPFPNINSSRVTHVHPCTDTKTWPTCQQHVIYMQSLVGPTYDQFNPLTSQQTLTAPTNSYQTQIPLRQQIGNQPKLTLIGHPTVVYWYWNPKFYYIVTNEL